HSLRIFTHLLHLPSGTITTTDASWGRYPIVSSQEGFTVALEALITLNIGFLGLILIRILRADSLTSTLLRQVLLNVRLNISLHQPFYRRTGSRPPPTPAELM